MSDRRPTSGLPRPRRRDLLAAVAAAATGGAAGTAGCLQASGTDGGDGTTGTGSGDPDPWSATTTEAGDAREKNANDPQWNPEGDPVETFAVGDRDAVAFPDNNQPHVVRLWNRVDAEREVRVAVGTPPSLELTAAGPVRVPANGVVDVELNVPAKYDLAITVEDEDFGNVHVGRRWVDCNDSRSRIALAEGELVDYGGVSTQMACPDPVVAEATVDVDDRGCASDGDPTATVAYDGEHVRVDGTFVASAPCYEFSVARADYDAERRTATVVLDATAPDEPCADCVGAVEYTASVDFDRDLPDRFELRHRDASGSDERVATAVRNGG